MRKYGMEYTEIKSYISKRPVAFEISTMVDDREVWIEVFGHDKLRRRDDPCHILTKHAPALCTWILANEKTMEVIEADQLVYASHLVIPANDQYGHERVIYKYKRMNKQLKVEAKGRLREGRHRILTPN